MTFVQAINQIEQAMTDLKLIDKFGEIIPGDMCVGIVANFHGPVWDDLVTQMYNSEIEPEEYATRALKLVNDFDRFTQRRNVEKKLLSLSVLESA